MPSKKNTRPRSLPKCPTGVRGLDQITNGGLPRGRPTLVCGGPGAGKTLLGLEFLVRGATEFDEPGVVITFEERPGDLSINTASLGFDLDDLVRRKKLLIDHVVIDRNQILESGEYDLEGLFIRLGSAIDQIGAKRVLLDTIESLFAALTNQGVLRAELMRLFTWLKEKGVTTLVTGERGDGALTRHGLEEYISDCVIVLDQRVVDQVSTRRLRIVKYRGSLHGANEYPFLIDETGFVVLPITSISLNYAASTEHVSTGVAKFDEMLDGKGFYRGSTVMISGSAGTGKTTLGAHFIDAACRRGERCVYFAFEESPAQIARNMRSVGLDLQRWIKRGDLRFVAARPASFGLETHINMMAKVVDEFEPSVAVVDPVSGFDSAGTSPDAHGMIVRLVDVLKSRGVTTLFTSLSPAGAPPEVTTIGVSSLIDTWILVRNLEQGGERTRGVSILKSRGQRHSNQIRELLITSHGLDLQDIYVGPEGVLAGAAREAQQLKDRVQALALEQGIAGKRQALARKRRVLRARIAELEAAFESEAQEISQQIAQEQALANDARAGRSQLAVNRGRATASRRKSMNGERP